MFFERCVETGKRPTKTIWMSVFSEVEFMGHRTTNMVTCAPSTQQRSQKASLTYSHPPTLVNYSDSMGMANCLTRFLSHLTDTIHPLHNLCPKCGSKHSIHHLMQWSWCWRTFPFWHPTIQTKNECWRMTRMNIDWAHDWCREESQWIMW